jgi:hypothetical protein
MPRGFDGGRGIQSLAELPMVVERYALTLGEGEKREEGKHQNQRELGGHEGSGPNALAAAL